MRPDQSRPEVPPPSVVPMWRPTFGQEEEDAVLTVMSSGHSSGEYVEEFEAGFARAAGARFAIATSSGAAALFLALKGHGLGAGDEVITSPLTSSATWAAIERTGARAVFADVDDTLGVAPLDVARVIGPRTRAILPVHLHGNPCDLRALSWLASTHGLPLVQDARHAVGATVAGHRLATYGTAAFSFGATRPFSIGKGGMVVTEDPEVADLCFQLRSTSHCTLTDVHAAIGLVQLCKFDSIQARRRLISSWYDQTIDAHRLPRPWMVTEASPAHCHYTLRVPEGQHARDALRSAMWRRGVATRVCYGVPLHLQVSAVGAYKPVRCVGAERAALDMLSIPIHHALTDAEVEHVSATVAQLVGSADRLGAA